MIVIDENFPQNQRQLLRGWRVRFRQIGHELGRRGMTDDDIIPLLVGLNGATFFSLDDDFYDVELCHGAYALVCLDVGQYEAAAFTRRVLRHPQLNTKAKRRGKVIRVTHAGLALWELHGSTERRLAWPR